MQERELEKVNAFYLQKEAEVGILHSIAVPNTELTVGGVAQITIKNAP